MNGKKKTPCYVLNHLVNGTSVYSQPYTNLGRAIKDMKDQYDELVKEYKDKIVENNIDTKKKQAWLSISDNDYSWYINKVSKKSYWSRVSIDIRFIFS